MSVHNIGAPLYDTLKSVIAPETSIIYVDDGSYFICRLNQAPDLVFKFYVNASDLINLYTGSGWTSGTTLDGQRSRILNLVNVSVIKYTNYLVITGDYYSDSNLKGWLIMGKLSTGHSYDLPYANSNNILGDAAQVPWDWTVNAEIKPVLFDIGNGTDLVDANGYYYMTPMHFRTPGGQLGGVAVDVLWLMRGTPTPLQNYYSAGNHIYIDTTNISDMAYDLTLSMILLNGNL